MNVSHAQCPKPNYQALLKAKYSPQVAAASWAQKTPKTHVTLTLTDDLEI